MAQLAKLTPTIAGGASDQAVAHGLVRVPTQIYIVEEDEGAGAKKALLAQCFTAIGAAIATVKSQVQIVAAAAFTVAGVHIAKGVTDNFWTLTGFDCTQNLYNKCLLCIDNLGAMQIGIGTEAATADGVVLPDTPADSCVVAILQVHPTSAGFVGGTTLLDAGGVNATYTDVGGHPNLFGEITLGKAADATNIYVDNTMQCARDVEIVVQAPHSIRA